jgi:hypothetical protein
MKVIEEDEDEDYLLTPHPTRTIEASVEREISREMS